MLDGLFEETIVNIIVKKIGLAFLIGHHRQVLNNLLALRVIPGVRTIPLTYDPGDLYYHSERSPFA